jgi:hypothetical protein
MIEELTNPYYLLAFVITPALVILLGYVSVRLHERSLDKHRQVPGE